MLADDAEILRFYYDLNETSPVQVISNYHRDPSDSWFDMHYAVEIGIVISGRMRREYLHHQKDIGPGQTWLCSIWEPHGFEIIEHPCEVLVFVADPAHLIHFNPFSFDLLRLFMIPPQKRPEISDTSAALELALRARERLVGNEHPNWAKLLFYELILMLDEQSESHEHIDYSYDDHKSIQPALRMVFEEKRLIKTAEAAQKCNLSASSFRNRFKELMGSSFADFALQYRLRGARAQLKNSNDTQQAIAKEWGFTDASHLHKYLKKL